MQLFFLMSSKSAKDFLSDDFFKNQLLSVLENPFLTDSYRKQLEEKLHYATQNN